MKTLCFLGLLIVLPSGAIAGDRIAEWQRDLDVLEAQLVEVHPRFRQCGLFEETRNAFRDIRRSLGDLSDSEITVEVQRLLATAGDGHTLLWPFGMKRGVLHRIPVMLWQFEDGIYVVDATDVDMVGRRVSKIGRLSVSEVLARLVPYVSHDNREQLAWATPFYATVTEFLVAIGASPTADSVTLTFDDGDAIVLGADMIDPTRLDLKLPAPPGPEVPPYLAHRASSLWWSKLPDGTAYVQLNAIDDDVTEMPHALRELLEGADRAVLDLRLNSGGEARKANQLLRALIAFDYSGGELVVLTSFPQHRPSRRGSTNGPGHSSSGKRQARGPTTSEMNAPLRCRNRVCAVRSRRG